MKVIKFEEAKRKVENIRKDKELTEYFKEIERVIKWKGGRVRYGK